jgi:hypothetical protein
MPSVSLSPAPKLQFFGTDGNILVGGKLYTYAAGTTTPLTTYYDSTGTAANTNPIILDTRGEANVWLDSSAYKFVLKTSLDTLIWTVDNITSAEALKAYILGLLAAPNGASLIGYTPTDSGGVTTVNNRLQLLDGVSPTTSGTDGNIKASINAFRDASAVTGGTAGYVNSTIYARTITGATETSFEWANLAIMDNYATAGENVALYGQGNKRGVGPTWGIVSEARDFTQTANPTKGLVGLEVGIFANNTDTNFQRVGIDISVGKGVAGGTINTTTYGLRVGPTNNDLTEGQVTDGIALNGNMVVGIQISSSGTWGIQLSGTYGIGVDLSSATTSTSAIRIKNGDNMAFDASSVYRLRHNSSGVAGLTYSVSGTDSVILSDAGGIVLGETVSWTSAYAFTSATAGTNGAPPAQVGGYIKVNINGSFVKIPYYAV